MIFNEEIKDHANYVHQRIGVDRLKDEEFSHDVEIVVGNGWLASLVVRTILFSSH